MGFYEMAQQLRYVLVLQRTQAGVPAHTLGGSQLPIIPSTENLMPLASVSTCIHMHTLTHKPTIRNLKNLIYDFHYSELAQLPGMLLVLITN